MKPKLAQSFPHIRRDRTTRGIMIDVLIALVPAAIASIWYFGWRALWLQLAAVAACMLTEAVCLLVRRHPAVPDGSAAVTGALLALSLPVGTPYWAVIVAAVFSIAVIKQLFGGIGHNLLNPAMAGRALLTVAFPQVLAGYTAVDAASGATPLARLGQESVLTMLFGRENGSMGETSALLILLGGAYLYLRGTIRLRVPMTCLWSFALVAWIFGGDQGLFTGDVVAHLLSGGIMLGAFFMVTDYTTKPTTPVGEWLYAGGVGVLSAVLRLWGPYPEGVCFAILLMNLAAPLIEYLTRRRVYGIGVRPEVA